MNQPLRILIAAVLFMTACAPKPEDRVFPAAKTNFGPRSSDADLSGGLKPSDKLNASLAWQGTVSTAAYFEQAENLIALGELSGRADLSAKGLSWIKNFYQKSDSTLSMELGQTPFSMLAAAQTQTEVQGSLDEVQGDLERARGIIRNHVLSLGSQIPAASAGGTLFEVIGIARKFTNLLLSSIEGLDVLPAIKDGLHEELVNQTTVLFDQVVPFARKFYAETNLSNSLSVIDEALTLFKVELDVITAKSLKDGHLIASGLDAMRDAQGALTVIVDVWRTLEPADRAKYFKTANETLYNFLVDQDHDDLSCLRVAGCNGGVFQGIKKKVFILPKISDYGVRRLHDELNRKALEYVVARVEGFAKEFLKEMPPTFATKIDEGLVAKGIELGKVSENYTEYLQKLMGRWSKKNLAESEGHVPGFEVSSLNVDISSKSAHSIQPMGNAMDLRANTAGSSMMANVLLMESSQGQEPLALRSALSQVNKLVSIGGYRDDQGRLIPALLAPVEHGSTPLDISNFTASRSSYRIPDRIRMSDSFHADEKMIYEKNFSASAFAEQIKGLSHMLKVTADWKHTSFDRILGGIKAQDLTHEVQTPALDRPLFPKDMLFALNVGDVAVLLQDITKKATPVFLLTLEKKVVWADQYDSSKADETAIMAGIVDIKDGRKSNVVQSRDVAKFLMAISDFLKATDGVENTKSSILLEKDAAGKAPIDSLIEGRKDLRLLVVALANFISNQLMNENHLIQANYYLQEMQRANNPEYLVEEQVFGIRALLRAFEITGINNYLFAAQEIYFAMNKKMFNYEEGFYVNGNGSKLDFTQKVAVLVATQELKSRLPEQSQAQLDRVSAPWLAALQALK